MKKGKTGDILKFCIFFGIGIFFIYWFLLKLDSEQKTAIWQAFVHARYGWVAAIMATIMLSHWVRALRWRLLYRSMHYEPRIGNTFGSVVIAYMANLAFPRLGEVARCATMRTSEQIPLDKSLGTVLTERVVDILAFFVIVLIGLVFLYGQARQWIQDTLAQRVETMPAPWLLAVALVGAIAVAVVGYRLCRRWMGHRAAFQRIDHFVTGCADGLRSIFHMGRRDTLLFLLYSGVIYLLYILAGLFIFQAFDATAGLGFGAAFVIYLFGSLGMTFSQGGIGLYPVLIQSALSLYGVDPQTGTAAGWLLWGAQQAIVIVVGLGWLVYFSKTKKKSR